MIETEILLLVLILIYFGVLNIIKNEFLVLVLMLITFGICNDIYTGEYLTIPMLLGSLILGIVIILYMFCGFLIIFIIQVVRDLYIFNRYKRCEKIKNGHRLALINFNKYLGQISRPYIKESFLFVELNNYLRYDEYVPFMKIFRNKSNTIWGNNFFDSYTGTPVIKNDTLICLYCNRNINIENEKYMICEYDWDKYIILCTSICFPHFSAHANILRKNLIISLLTIYTGTNDKKSYLYKLTPYILDHILHYVYFKIDKV